MTVGEKIHFYRKKIGISQEELGQKLFVSRQTISLWEMDKTLPTVDNLIRLREIFDVSIDDILSEIEPTETTTEKKEAYQFEYTKSDLRSIFKNTIRPLVVKFVVFVSLCVAFFLFFIISNAPDVLIGLLIGLLIAGLIVYIKALVVSKKTWVPNERRMLECVYKYDVFDEYFVLNISKNGAVTKTFKVFFEEIEKIKALKNFLIVQCGGQTYIFDNNSLNEDSRLRFFCEKHPEKIDTKAQKDPLKAVSIILFALSIASIFAAMLCVALMYDSNRMDVENMWVFFLFTPISIASLIFGACPKKNGKKHVKNFVVGIVITVLLCIYGSFTFIFSGIYSHDEAPILRIEETLEIDIPEYSRINTQDWTKGTQSVPRGYIFSTSDIYFEEDAVKEFEQKLPYDSKWMTVITSDLVGITSYFFDTQVYDYFIIYNVETKEFNHLPSASGKYRFINVMYNTAANTMKIVEYEIEYIK